MTRTEALSCGVKQYNEGKPCKCGSTLRWTSNSSCVACIKANSQSSEGRRRQLVYRQKYDKTEKKKFDQKKYRQSVKGKAYHQIYHIKTKYGISSEFYQSMLAEQKGKCAVCLLPMSPPCVDHDHVSSNVRGLLCRDCNWILGKAKDDPTLLRRAAVYLEER